MKKVSSNSPWKKDLREETIYSPLNKDIECDILIIGGGITGALTAYYASKNNVDAIVLEKGLINHESTFASTSILHYEIDTDLIRLSSFVGDNAEKAFKMCLNAVDDIEGIVGELNDDCEFIRRPSFYYTDNVDKYDYMYDEYMARKNIGIDVTFLDGDKDKDKYSFDFKAGIYSPNSGAEINPVKFTYELFDWCNKRGIDIYENSVITEIDLDNNIAYSNNNTIKFNKLIMATGYDILNYFDKPFWTMTRTFALLTHPVENFHGWFGRSLIKDDLDPYTYIRTTIDDRIIIGGEDIEISEFDIDKQNMDDSHPLALQKYQTLEKRLNILFPQIDDLKIDVKFDGIFVDSDDGLPYYGIHHEYPNIYFNMSVGSNGILYGLLGGKLIIDKHVNNDDTIDMYSFKRTTN